MNTYVLSANVHRRHLTKGQQAMAVALAFPETRQGKKRTSSKIEEVNVASGYVSQARFVLRNCRDKAEEVLRNPHYPLSTAYVLSANVHRRHITKGQQAARRMVAVAEWGD